LNIFPGVFGQQRCERKWDSTVRLSATQEIKSFLWGP